MYSPAYCRWTGHTPEECFLLVVTVLLSTLTDTRMNRFIIIPRNGVGDLLMTIFGQSSFGNSSQKKYVDDRIRFRPFLDPEIFLW